MQAMVDVDETYASLWRDSKAPTRRRGRKVQKADQPSGTESLGTQPVDPEIALITKRVESCKLTSANNIKRRHIEQVFIRGDNVVCIHAPSS